MMDGCRAGPFISKGAAQAHSACAGLRRAGAAQDGPSPEQLYRRFSHGSRQQCCSCRCSRSRECARVHAIVLLPTGRAEWVGPSGLDRVTDQTVTHARARARARLRTHARTVTSACTHAWSRMHARKVTHEDIHSDIRFRTIRPELSRTRVRKHTLAQHTRSRAYARMVTH
jgi:hypothetical protein